MISAPEHLISHSRAKVAAGCARNSSSRCRRARKTRPHGSGYLRLRVFNDVVVILPFEARLTIQIGAVSAGALRIRIGGRGVWNISVICCLLTEILASKGAFGPSPEHTQ